MLLIVDYGMSNLRSVAKACEALGANVTVSGLPEAFDHADKVILPGVGAFGHAVAELKFRRLIAPLKSFIASKKPFLGICLGLQLLFESSEEAPGVPGLAVIPGRIARFPAQPGLKIPHMGWNQLHIKKKQCPLFDGVPENSYVYFVHSYYASALGDVLAAECHYGVSFTAAAWQNNVFGVQFHPEKSQATGLKILKNFIDYPIPQC